MVMRWSGLRVNTRPRISFSSLVIGSMVCRNDGCLVNARYVESSNEACFHGFFPVVRLTRMTPRDQTSFGAQ